MLSKERAFLKFAVSICLISLKPLRGRKSNYWSLSLFTARLVTFSPRWNRHRRPADRDRINADRLAREGVAILERKGLTHGRERLTFFYCGASWNGQARPWFKKLLICYSLICRQMSFMQKTGQDSFLCLLLIAQADAAPTKAGYGTHSSNRVKLDGQHEELLGCLPLILLLE